MSERVEGGVSPRASDSIMLGATLCAWEGRSRIGKELCQVGGRVGKLPLIFFCKGRC